MVNEFLDNPVYHALCSGEADKALGSDLVKFFEVEISPFAGIKDGYANGFEDLQKLLPPKRKILYATREKIPIPGGWTLLRLIEGSQFLFLSKNDLEETFQDIVPLENNHVGKMTELAELTRPGPFASRTIEFGNYHGIFDGEKLVAMTGRRLHVYGYIEVSAVCTHPDHVGKGYAGALLRREVNSILKEGKVPFLHVRSDNTRAINLYEHLGFVRNGDMKFYFLENSAVK